MNVLFLLSSVALAGTWPYRAPVPTQAPSDGQPFSVCLEIGAELGFDGQRHEEGNVSWTCTSEEDVSTVCYDVAATPWPTKWPTLLCEGANDRVKVSLIEAFDPASDLSKGARISSKVDEATAVFIVGDRFPSQVVQGARGASCQVADGRLYVSRTTSSRRRDQCSLRTAEGGRISLRVK
jgi:hypothetical protein